MRSVSLALFFGTMLTAHWAGAQPRDPAPEDAPPEPSFDRPVVETAVYPAECSEREEADIDAAKGLHRAAKLYFARERYADAVDAWTSSHRFDCTAHRLLLNIATAYERLGDVVGARAALAQYLARAPEPYAEGAIDKYEALLQRHVPRRLVEPTPEPGGPEVAASEVPLSAWITLGAGAATTAAGVALFTVGAVQTQRSCPEDPSSCTRVERLDAEEGITFQHTGGVLMALGLTSMAVAGVLTWVAIEAPDNAPDLSFHVGPTSFSMTGRF